MLQFPNIYKRLLIYTLISNKFPLQCSEIIWWLIQLSEVPVEIKYHEDGYIKCQLISYGVKGRRTKSYKSLQPRNVYEEQIVERFLELIIMIGSGE